METKEKVIAGAILGVYVTVSFCLGWAIRSTNEYLAERYARSK